MVEKRLNTVAAEIFRECAGILQHQEANPYLVNAYVRAANVLESLDIDVRRLLERVGARSALRWLAPWLYATDGEPMAMMEWAFDGL